MTITKINQLIEKRNQLTDKRKKRITLGIRANKKARKIAINGAIKMKN